MLAGCPIFNQDLYVPDTANAFQILHRCNNYRSTVSIPNNVDTGLFAMENTVGAVVYERDTGTTKTVKEGLYPNGVHQNYYWEIT